MIDEKAKSKAQQRFFGMVDAYKKGDMPDASPSIKKAAKSMTKKQVKDFAETKHKGLPNHVTESTLRDIIKEAIGNYVSENKNNPVLELRYYVERVSKLSNILNEQSHYLSNAIQVSLRTLVETLGILHLNGFSDYSFSDSVIECYATISLGELVQAFMNNKEAISKAQRYGDLDTTNMSMLKNKLAQEPGIMLDYMLDTGKIDAGNGYYCSIYSVPRKIDASNIIIQVDIETPINFSNLDSINNIVDF